MGNAKFFGEYLVEKGIIDQGTLVDALVHQIKQLPSTVEVVWELKLLSSEMVLKIFKVETEKGTTFTHAARELGCWTDAFDSAVSAYLKKVRIPLGQILIARGALTVDKMTTALDEFLGDWSAAQSKNHEVKQGVVNSKPATGAAATVSPQAPVSLSESSSGSSATFEFCIQEFSKERLTMLSKFFDGMVVSAPPSNELTQAREILQKFQGTARLIAAASLEQLVDRVGGMLEKFVQLPKAKSEEVEILGGIAIVGADATLVLRDMIESIKVNGNENTFMGDASKSELIKSAMKASDEMIASIK